MTKLTPTRRIALIALICFLGAVALYVIGFRFIEGKRETLTALRHEVQALGIKTTQAQQRRMIVADTTELRNELYAQLVPTGDPADMLALIETLATDAQVSLEIQSVAAETIPSAEKEEKERRPAIGVTLSIEGRWVQVYHMVSLLETLPYASSVVQVNFERKSTGGDTWTSLVHLQVEAR